VIQLDNDATLAEAVRRHIVLTLASCGGNRTHAAKILNISLRCLRDKLRGYAGAGMPVTPVQQQKSRKSARFQGTEPPSMWQLGDPAEF
jgi:hypothetical protein